MDKLFEINKIKSLMIILSFWLKKNPPKSGFNLFIPKLLH